MQNIHPKKWDSHVKGRNTAIQSDFNFKEFWHESCHKRKVGPETTTFGLIWPGMSIYAQSWQCLPGLPWVSLG